MMGARIGALRARFRAEFKAALELVLLPGLAAVLPWRLCFACFRLFSRLPFLYRMRCQQSLAAAQALGFVDDPVRWLRRYRLVTLVDHADFYLARFRTDRWRRRHLQRHGAWPEAPFLGCTFHWGAGMWALRDVACSGIRAHALVGALPKEYFRGQTVTGRYSFARIAEVGRALGTEPVDVGRDLRQVLAAVERKEALLAAVDVPPDQASSSLPMRFLDQEIRVPHGLFRLAARHRLPVVFYLTGLDFSSGERFLHITEPLVGDDAEGLARQAYETLETWVRRQPECWHFWFIFDRFRPPAGG